MIWHTLYAAIIRTVVYGTDASRALEARADAMPCDTDEQYEAVARLRDDAYGLREFREVREVQEIELGTSNDCEGLFVRDIDGKVRQHIGLMQFRANDHRSLLRQLNTAGGGRPLSCGSRNEVARWFGTEAGARRFLSVID
jgi:hypothetical protein